MQYYLKSKRFVLHARIFFLTALMKKGLFIPLSIYILFSLFKNEFAGFALFGIIAYILLWIVIKSINFLIAKSMKCDKCKKNPSIKKEAPAGFFQGFSQAVHEIKNPKKEVLIPEVLVSGTFSCINCGHQYRVFR